MSENKRAAVEVETEWVDIYTKQSDIRLWWEYMPRNERTQLEQDFAAFESDKRPSSGWPDGVGPSYNNKASINAEAKKAQDEETAAIIKVLSNEFGVGSKKIDKFRAQEEKAEPKRMNRLYFYAQKRAQAGGRGGFAPANDMSEGMALFIGFFTAIFYGLVKGWKAIKNLFNWKKPGRSLGRLLFMAIGGYIGWAHWLPANAVVIHGVPLGHVISLLLAMSIAAFAFKYVAQGISWMFNRGALNPTNPGKWRLSAEQAEHLKNSNQNIMEADACIKAIHTAKKQSGAFDFPKPPRHANFNALLSLVKNEGVTARVTENMKLNGLYQKDKFLDSINKSHHSEQAQKNDATTLEQAEIAPHASLGSVMKGAGHNQKPEKKKAEINMDSPTLDAPTPDVEMALISATVESDAAEGEGGSGEHPHRQQ